MNFLVGFLALPLGFCIAIVVAGTTFSLAPPMVALPLTVVLLALVVGLLLAWANGLFDDPQIAKDEAAALAAQERELAEQRDALFERLRYARFEPRYGGQIVGVTHEEELARIERRLRMAL